MGWCSGSMGGEVGDLWGRGLRVVEGGDPGQVVFLCAIR